MKLVYELPGKVNTVEEGKTNSIELTLQNISKSVLAFEDRTESEYGSFFPKNGIIYHDTGVQMQGNLTFFRFVAPGDSFKKLLTLKLMKPVKNKRNTHKFSVQYIKVGKGDLDGVFIGRYDRLAVVIDDTLLDTDNPFIKKLPFKNPKSLEELKGAAEGIILGLKETQQVFEIELEVKPGNHLRNLYEAFDFKEIEDIIRSNELAGEIIRANHSTYLVSEGKHIDIGDIDLGFFSLITERTPVWIIPTTGCISEFFKYGVNLREKEPLNDQRYHGHARYRIDLPKSELENLFSCIKDGEYRIVIANDVFVNNEIRVIGR